MLSNLEFEDQDTRALPTLNFSSACLSDRARVPSLKVKRDAWGGDPNLASLNAFFPQLAGAVYRGRRSMYVALVLFLPYPCGELM
jgi:hypothetical protein